MRAVARYCPNCGRHLPSGSLAAGTRIGQQGRYTIVRLLGAGGFGEVYLANDIVLGRVCVVKRLRLRSDLSQTMMQQIISSFDHEAHMLVLLNTPGHPHIPEIYDYLEADSCLVMKYISGYSLQQILVARRAELSEEAILRYGRDLASALSYMHNREKPILHRDVKPANVLLDTTMRIWLIDFGLSFSGDNPSFHSGGTPGYAAPEQWQGQAAPPSDVYSLGATLFCLLTGYTPDHSMVSLLIQGQASWPSLSEFVAPVRPEVERLLTRTLAFEPAGRPTAQELFEALEQLIAAVMIPPPPPPAPLPLPEPLVIREVSGAIFQQLADHGAIALSGPAGVGKSALAAHLFLQNAGPADSFWHSCRAGAGAEELVQALAAFLARQGRNDLWRQISVAHQMGNPLPPLELLLNYISQTLLDLSAERRNAGRPPLLLCFDDWHLAEDDPELQHLCARIYNLARAGGPQLLLLVRRAPVTLSGIRVIPLAGMNLNEARQLPAEHNRLSDTQLERLITATAGNPQLLLLSGSLIRDADDLEQIVERLIASSDIERYLLYEVTAGLSEAEQRVMEALAILLDEGGSRDLLEELLDGANIGEVLNQLVGRNLVLRSPGRNGIYRQSMLVQRFFYEQFGRRERRRLHLCAAEYYTSAQAEPLRAVRHFLYGGAPERSAVLAVSEGEAMVRRGQAHLLSTLLQELPAGNLDPSLQAALASLRGEIAALLGDYTLAQTLLESALEQGSIPGAGAEQLAAQARRRRLLAGIAERTGDYAKAEDYCRAGLALLAGLSRPHLETPRLYEQLATVLTRRGNLNAAEQACHEGVASLPAEPAAARERAYLQKRAATIAGQRGDYATAINALEQCLIQARRADDPLLQAAVLNNLGTLLISTDNLKRGLECLAASLELKGQLGDIEGQVATLINQGAAYQAVEDFEAALRCFEESRTICLRLHLQGWLALTTSNIGVNHYLCAELLPARASFRAAEELFRTLGDDYGRVDVLYRLGDVMLGLGEPAEALEYGEVALALARQIGSPAYESCALRVAGEALTALGRLDEAGIQLTEAYQLQEQVGDPFDQALNLVALARLELARGNRAGAAAQIAAGQTLTGTYPLPYPARLLEQLQAHLGQ